MSLNPRDGFAPHVVVQHSVEVMQNLNVCLT